MKKNIAKLVMSYCTFSLIYEFIQSNLLHIEFNPYKINLNFLFHLGGLPSICPESHFSCKNLKCIKGVSMCDGKDDCGDKSDEINGCKGKHHMSLFHVTCLICFIHSGSQLYVLYSISIIR